MRVKVKKLTDISLMHRAIEATVLEEIDSKMSLEKIYECQHSPIRTQLFWIEITDVYSYVSTHLVRHNIGVTHFVSSRREDRGGSLDDGRYSLVKHSMLVNAEALINISRKRLCYKASTDTFQVMNEIKLKISGVDSSLAKFMVPDCLYRQGCHELKSCGYWERLDG